MKNNELIKLEQIWTNMWTNKSSCFTRWCVIDLFPNQKIVSTQREALASFETAKVF